MNRTEQHIPPVKTEEQQEDVVMNDVPDNANDIHENASSNGRPWSKEEENLLLLGVRTYGVNSWSKTLSDRRFHSLIDRSLDELRAKVQELRKHHNISKMRSVSVIEVSSNVLVPRNDLKRTLTGTFRFPSQTTLELLDAIAAEENIELRTQLISNAIYKHFENPSNRNITVHGLASSGIPYRGFRVQQKWVTKSSD